MKAHQSALDASERQGPAQLGVGPIELILQSDGPDGHSVEQRHSGQHHGEATQPNQKPAIEDAAPAEYVQTQQEKMSPRLI